MIGEYVEKMHERREMKMDQIMRVGMIVMGKRYKRGYYIYLMQGIRWKSGLNRMLDL